MGSYSSEKIYRRLKMIYFSKENIEDVFKVSSYVSKKVLNILRQEILGNLEKHPLDQIAIVFDQDISDDPYVDYALHDTFFGVEILREPRNSKADVVHFLKRWSPDEKTFIWVSKYGGESSFYICSFNDLLDNQNFYDITLH